MRKKWRRLFSRFAVVTGLFLLSSPAIPGDAGKALAAGPRPGGALTVGVELEFRGFDPLKAVYLQPGDRSVITAVEERLFGMDYSGKLIPELALSATPSAEGKSWTIRLRQGVLFHDGTPFNADAVVEHWQRMLAPDHRYSGATYIEPVQSVTKIDDYTLQFTLKHPWVAFLTLLSSTQWTGAFIPSPKAMRENTLNRAPVGTGPFIFKEWIARDRLVLVRNPGYWRKGMPYLDSVTFRPLPDTEARFSGLLSGETDVILTDRGAHIIRAGKDPSLKVYSADASGPYTFILNTDNKPLDDVRVRRALAHAWNQELFLTSEYQGTRPVARDPFGNTLTCDNRAYREYDPAKARELLAEYGNPVTLEFLETDTPREHEAGEVMRRLFKDVGVTLKVTRLTESKQVERVMDGDYEISGWRMMDLSDMGPYLNVCLNSEGKLNFSRYRNPAMDSLLMTMRKSTDEKARQKALCGIADLINGDVMYLYGGGRRFHAITKASVEGLGTFDDGIVRVSEAWIKVKEKKVEKVKKNSKVNKVKNIKKVK